MVIPYTSSYFSVPNTTSDDPDIPALPIPWSDLPLYKYDYVGLRSLNERGRVHMDECEGRHMRIDRECWDRVLDWLERPGGRDSLATTSRPLFVNQAELPAVVGQI
jgi:palmitoyl-protein thioesterase